MNHACSVDPVQGKGLYSKRYQAGTLSMDEGCHFDGIGHQVKLGAERNTNQENTPQGKFTWQGEILRHLPYIEGAMS
jgi:hypothetical protein